MPTGQSEFGGGGGMVQPEQETGPDYDGQKAVWGIYASDVDDPADDGTDLSKVGKKQNKTQS